MIQVKSEHAMQSLGSKKSLARNCGIRQNYACSGFARSLFWKKNDIRVCLATYKFPMLIHKEWSMTRHRNFHSINTLFFLGNTL
jgi:hypothetical protein